jgi:Holliday junction DNA helicase RuvA
MIGKLTGTIDSYGEDYVILDVGGVGYEVHVPVRTLSTLPQAGERATLSIETYIREDMIRLYGFATDLDREWFRLLQTVQGVGARVALAILGVLKAGEVATAIALQDKATLGRAPGVGKKLAERLVIELRDKAPKYASADPEVLKLRTDLAEHRAPRAIADAVSALVNLGYAEVQASAAVAAAARLAGEAGSEATPEQLIRAGLKELAR